MSPRNRIRAAAKRRFAGHRVAGESAPAVERESLAATLSADEIECALRTLAALWNDEDPDNLSQRQLDVMARLGRQYTAEMFGEDE